MTIRSLIITALALMAFSSSLVRAQDGTASPPTATATLNLMIESTGDIERTVTTYYCDRDTQLTAHYINAAPNFLAIIPVDRKHLIFATTIATSGVRYMSGPYEWWSKGDEAILRDLTQGENAPPLATCRQADDIP